MDRFHFAFSLAFDYAKGWIDQSDWDTTHSLFPLRRFCSSLLLLVLPQMLDGLAKFGLASSISFRLFDVVLSFISVSVRADNRPFSLVVFNFSRGI